MSIVREPAVAGMFYPLDADLLRGMIRDLLASAKAAATIPKAIIVPHAGYDYSGPIAASAYASVVKGKERIKSVVLMGPAHYVAFNGLAAHSADAFATPLGAVPLDRDAIEAACDLTGVRRFDEAHREEHSLEVQLPFLQEVLTDFVLVPLAVGEGRPEDVGAVLDKLWGGPETLIVVSSDLSHYHDYETANRRDGETSRAIEAFQFEKIDAGRACGCYPVAGLLMVARRRGLHVEVLDLRNSGDTAGPRDHVVGYGAYCMT